MYVCVLCVCVCLPDEHLGGFQLDLRLAELLADKFNEKWHKGKGKVKKEDIRGFPKAMAKIRAQVCW